MILKTQLDQILGGTRSGKSRGWRSFFDFDRPGISEPIRPRVKRRFVLTSFHAKTFGHIALISVLLTGVGLGAGYSQTAPVDENGRETIVAAVDASTAASAPAAASATTAAVASPTAAASTTAADTATDPAQQAPAQLAQGQPPFIEVPPAAPNLQACDDACVRTSADYVAQSCVPLIEAKAPADYDWLSRPFGGMFTQAEKSPDGIVRYRGDSIRILSQNQWLRFAYECAYDPVRRKIASVLVRPGRLIPPAAVAQAAGGLIGQQTAQAAPTAAQIQHGPLVPQKPMAKPRPRIGEPTPVSIGQARLHTPEVDTLTRIAQVSLRPTPTKPRKLVR